MTTDRRLFLALGLCVVFLFVWQAIFPPPKPRAVHGADSVAMMQHQAESARAAGAAAVAAQHAATAPTPGGSLPSTGPATASAVTGATIPTPTAHQATTATVPETLTVTTPHTIVSFTSTTAAPVNVIMHDYHVTVRDVALRNTSPLVRLGRPGEPLLSYFLVVGHDTLSFAGLAFHGMRTTAADSTPVVRYEGDVPMRTGGAVNVVLTYAFTRDGYLSNVSGTVRGLPGQAPAYLLVALPSGFPSSEADTADDFRQLAYSFKPIRDDPSSITFSHLQPGKTELHPGPIEWVAAKDKYFLVGVLAPDTTRAHQFAELDLGGAPRVGSVAEHAAGDAVLPLWNGPTPGVTAFAFQLYMGPQDYRRLRALGRGFENLNPYGGFFHVILQPFVTLVVVAILGMHSLLQINYGWILIIFGVVTRIVLWPLNQRAMRTSLKMQRLQPELQEVQNKYKGDQQRAQQELMRVYKEHGMSPWSPVAGCLPMLLPWPIFAALYFVFRTTIEFRGVSFMWMHDISVKDPYYIMPVLMGLTSLLVSWIGMRGMPPSPQTKMMSYMFPVMMTVFFWNIAGGLNLYYFVQNLATIPQQWYLANERAKANDGATRPKNDKAGTGQRIRSDGHDKAKTKAQSS